MTKPKLPKLSGARQPRIRPRQPVLLAELPRHGNEVTHVILDQYQGEDRLDLRIWYRTSDGKLHPTRKGVPIPADKLDALSDAIDKAKAALSDQIGLERKPKNSGEQDDGGPPWEDT